MVLEGVTLSIVLTTALVDSINPCAIGVLVLLLSTLVGLSQHRNRMLLIGLIYIAVVYVTYLLDGLGLIVFQGFLISLGLATLIGTLVGVVTVLLGLVEIKDFFWYGQGFSLAIPARYVSVIKERAKNVTIVGAMALGALVAMAELPCTGGPYLALTTILARRFDWLAFNYLLLYNFIFILPLLVILFMVYFGTRVVDIKRWKQEKRKWMRLATGLLMVALGIFLILFYQGYILTLG